MMNEDAIFNYGLPKICQLALQGASAELKSFLEKAPHLINTEDHKGWRPIHHAARQNNLECIKILIQHDAEVNRQTYQLDTPLDIACQFSASIPVLEELLKSKAQFSKIKYRFMNSLNKVIASNNLDTIKLLVAKGAADLDQTDATYGSPLQAAMHSSSSDMLVYLLEQGAEDVVCPDLHHLTALHRTVIDTNLGFMKILFEYNVSQENINKIDSRIGSTPLGLACEQAWEDGAFELINHGSNVNHRNYNDETPLYSYVQNIINDKLDVESNKVKRLLGILVQADSGNIGDSFTVRKGNHVPCPFMKTIKAGNVHLYKSFLMMGVHHNAGSYKTSEFMIPFVDRKKEVTCTPLAFLSANLERKQNEYLKLAETIIEKEDLTRAPTDQISPLLALFSQDRSWEPNSPERRMFRLLVENGADLFAKFRIDAPHSADIFLLPLLQKSYKNLLFLLMEVIPGQKVFASTDCEAILQLYQTTANGSNQYEVIQSLAQIHVYLEIVNVFVPQLPCELLKKLKSPKRKRSETKGDTNILTICKTPKSLKHLSALQIRKELWEANKNSWISNSVEKLKNEIGLLDDFVDILLLREPMNTL